MYSDRQSAQNCSHLIIGKFRKLYLRAQNYFMLHKVRIYVVFSTATLRGLKNVIAAINAARKISKHLLILFNTFSDTRLFAMDCTCFQKSARQQNRPLRNFRRRCYVGDMAVS
jgi:hypothetical protein